VKQTIEICNLRMKVDDHLILSLLTAKNKVRLSHELHVCAFMRNGLESNFQYRTSLADYLVV
jgi:hypothetical protein